MGPGKDGEDGANKVKQEQMDLTEHKVSQEQMDPTEHKVNSGTNGSDGTR
jgi:hypothetical protein